MFLLFLCAVLAEGAVELNETNATSAASITPFAAGGSVRFLSKCMNCTGWDFCLDNSIFYCLRECNGTAELRQPCGELRCRATGEGNPTCAIATEGADQATYDFLKVCLALGAAMAVIICCVPLCLWTKHVAEANDEHTCSSTCVSILCCTSRKLGGATPAQRAATERAERTSGRASARTSARSSGRSSVDATGPRDFAI